MVMEEGVVQSRYSKYSMSFKVSKRPNPSLIIKGGEEGSKFLMSIADLRISDGKTSYYLIGGQWILCHTEEE
jgi:hypothetical protein